MKRDKMKTFIKRNKCIYDFLCKKYAHLQILKNRLKADNKKLKEFQSRYKGKSCFIVGTGPSLTVEDLNHLKNEICFAPNKIYKIFSQTDWRPTFFVVSDNDITSEMYKVSSCFDSGIKAKFFPANFRKDCKGSNLNAYFYNYVGCDTTGKIMPEFSGDITKYIVEGYSVTYVAMQLAVYMGFTEIYLLGIDFSWPIYKDCKGNIYENDSVKHRFYEKNHELDEISIPNVELMENAYKQAKNYCDLHGIHIYNATRGGKLEIFSRVDFDSAI